MAKAVNSNCKFILALVVSIVLAAVWCLAASPGAMATQEAGNVSASGVLAVQSDSSKTASDISSISYKFAGGAKFRTGVDGHWANYYYKEGGERKSARWFYYDDDLGNSYRDGNLLTIKYKDGSTTSYCLKNYKYVNAEKSSDSIRAEKVEISWDQSYQNQWSVDNPGHAIITYKGFTCKVPVHMIPKITGISYKFAGKKLQFRDRVDGHWEDYYYEGNKKKAGRWFHYDDVFDCDFREGNRLTLKYEDGSSSSYRLEDVNGGWTYVNVADSSDSIPPGDIVDISWDQSYHNQWGVNNPGHAVITYLGFTCKVPFVRIIPNTTKRIVYKPAGGECSIAKETGGSWSDEGPYDPKTETETTADKLWYWYSLPVSEGDKLIVYNTNGKKTVYVCDKRGCYVDKKGNEAPGMLGIDDNQSSKNEWKIGKKNCKMEITYNSKTCEVPVRIGERLPNVKMDRTLPYTGEDVRANITMKDGGTILQRKTDYTVEWPDECTNVGSYQLVVRGKGKYAGAKTVKFKVVKAKNEVSVGKTAIAKTVKASTLKEKDVAVRLPKVTAKFGKAEWKVVRTNAKGILSLNGKKVVVAKGAESGSYVMKLKAVVPKTKNYKAARTQVVTVKATVK